MKVIFPINWKITLIVILLLSPIKTFSYPWLETASQIGFRIGRPFIGGYISSGDVSLQGPILYGAINFKHRIFHKKNIYLLYELGYLTYGWTPINESIENVVHAFPLTVSFVFQINIADRLFISPNAGLGYMFLYTKAETTILAFKQTVEKYSSMFLGTTGFDLSIVLSKRRLFLNIGVNLIIGKDINTKTEGTGVYFIPTLGLKIRI